VVVWPGSSVAVLGVAVKVKLFAAVIVSVPEDTALCPLAVTVTGPVAAPVGMTNDKLVELAPETEAGIVPPPCWLSVACGIAPFAVKLVPVTVMAAPAEADAGLKPVIVGGGAAVTVNVTPLLATPETVTTTFPVVAPLGTGTTIVVAFQLVGVPTVPLNVTVLVPCVVPKFVPVIVTELPAVPVVGLRLVMLGVGSTVNATPLLAAPETVTTTFPVVAPLGTGTTILVALQLVGVAEIPLNVTVLVPCDVPKFVPVIVTGVPTAPDVGLRLVMLAGAPEPAAAARKATICIIKSTCIVIGAVAL